MHEIIQEIVTRRRKENDLIAAGLGVIKNGEPAAIAVDGVRKLGGDVPVTVKDKWHLGSVTKSMTATMIARLVEAGHLKFNDPLGDLLSGYPMHTDWKRVSLEQLLTHRAGVIANFPEDSFEGDRSVEDFSAIHEKRQYWVKDLLSRKPDFPPGRQFVYSNAGYAVAGLAASEAVNSIWEQLMIDELFTPLGMASAGFGAPKGEQPLGHGFDPATKQKIPMETENSNPDNPPFFGPAGNVHVSLKDLLSYGDEHLKGRKGESSFLSALTFSKLHTIPDPLESYAFGWAVSGVLSQKGSFLQHAGSNTIWYAMVYLSPFEDTVIAFVTNECDLDKMERISKDVVRAVLA